MGKPNKALLARERRHARVRRSLVGTAGCPRLNVYRSLKNIYAQIIDDSREHTLLAVSSLDPSLRPNLAGKTKSQQAAQVGKLLAERAIAAGVKEVVFDRGSYLFHGRVKALADAAREGGLSF